MYEISDAYLKQTKKKVQSFRLKGKLHNIDFTHHDIMSGSFGITNQCSEQNEVKIGSVYIAEMKCTFKPDISVPDWDKAEITVSEGLYIEETGQYEDVQLGVFYVSSAEGTDYGTDVVAYDAMYKFNKTCDLDTTIGTPYELAVMACKKCDVELGMAEAEMKSFANGTEELSLYTENDIETWQDFIFWLAQSIGAFATMNRYGKLVFRSYGQTCVDSLSDHNRFNGSKFSKFQTRYSGLSCVNIADNSTSYYGTDPDNYLTYNLGSNPFLQYGVEEYKERIRRNVLNALLDINYVPFETSVLCGAMYDLGDVICCTDGIAPGENGCIMYYDYTFNNGYKIAGYGANPELSTAKNKSDKNLEGLRSNVSSKDILFFTYENASAVTIGDEETNAIIDIRFTSSKSIGVLFQAEVLLTAEATVEDVIGTISYELNEAAVLGYTPTETWKNGKHILSLMYMLMIEENSINRWVVRLNVSGGTVSINQGGIRAVVYGQGLVGTVEWDGYITIEEKLAAIAMSHSVTVDKNVSEEVLVALIDVDSLMIEDSLPNMMLQKGPAVSGIKEMFDIRWGIVSWTFNTDSEATYASRYVDISEEVYKLASSFINKSKNEVIDSGKMNVVSIDSTEFETITDIVISSDESAVKYLICAEGIWYTVLDDVLTEITLSGETVSYVDFMTSGMDTEPASAILITLTSPAVYKWTSEDSIQEMTASITASSHAQTIQTICDMSDASIYGITDVAAEYTGDVRVRLSYDGGLIFTEEELLADALTGSLLQAYENLNENKILTIAFIISSTEDTLTQFKYSFSNEEV